MTRARTIRNFPKTGWRNRTARLLLAFRSKPARTDFPDYQTKTPLRLPFDGEWYVYWGGRSIAQNYHAKAPDQRFAYDFLMLRTGKSFSGSGDRNEDYYCFDQAVCAPGDALVVRAVDEVADNSPGEMNSRRPFGNFVILDHGQEEFSFLVHLKRGTVRVVSGDMVKSGAVIGHCGNSGRSSEPHLHFHLQNTSAPYRGAGLPAFFCHYIVKGKTIARAEPVAGQFIRHAGPYQ